MTRAQVGRHRTHHSVQVRLHCLTTSAATALVSQARVPFEPRKPVTLRRSPAASRPRAEVCSSGRP